MTQLYIGYKLYRFVSYQSIICYLFVAFKYTYFQCSLSIAVLLVNLASGFVSIEGRWYSPKLTTCPQILERVGTVPPVIFQSDIKHWYQMPTLQETDPTPLFCDIDFPLKSETDIHPCCMYVNYFFSVRKINVFVLNITYLHYFQHCKIY